MYGKVVVDMNITKKASNAFVTSDIGIVETTLSR